MLRRCLGSYFDILCIRTFPSLKNREDDYSELYITQFIKYCGVPVISLESATFHPLQSLTDIITITECQKLKAKSQRPKIVLTWAPHQPGRPAFGSNAGLRFVLVSGSRCACAPCGRFAFRIFASAGGNKRRQQNVLHPKKLALSE